MESLADPINEKTPAPAQAPESASSTPSVYPTKAPKLETSFNLDAVPAALRDARCWSIWNPRIDPQRAKAPRRAIDGQPMAKSSDPSTFHSLEEVVKFARNMGTGIGTQAAGHPGIVAFDLDAVFGFHPTEKNAKGEPRGYRWDEGQPMHPRIVELIGRVGSVTMRSPSGSGLRLYVKGKPALEPGRHGYSWKPADGGHGEIKVAVSNFFMTFTGDLLPGFPTEIQENQAAIDWVLATYPPAAAPAPKKAAAAPTVKDVAPFADMDDPRLEKVSDRTKALIVCGSDVNGDRIGDGSRSDVVFHVVSELIRAGISDSEIFTILTTKDFAVSESILERGSDAERYATHTIENARARVGDETDEFISASDPNAQADQARKELWPTLKSFRDDFLVYRRGAFIALADKTVRAEVRAWSRTKKFIARDKEGNAVAAPYVPTKKKLEEIEVALADLTHIAQDRFEPPCWIGDAAGRPPARECLAFPNGILHLPSGEVLPPSPDLFTRNALDFNFDPNAPTPAEWLRFLESLKLDEDEVRALQEYLGLLLVPDTSFQKAFLLVGPPRSGKGTIGRIIELLIGLMNCVGRSLNDFGRQSFCLEPLIGKTVAIISEFSIGRGTDASVVAERIKKIIGEDTVTIDRKFKGAVTIRLGVRFVLMSNDVPTFDDSSGALAARLIVVRLTESFLGREDLDLDRKLGLELPGILNWSIEGWRRVKTRGHFIQPAKGAEVLGQIRATSTPIPDFVAERCEVGPDFEVPKEALWNAFRTWDLSRNGGEPTIRKFQAFFNSIYAAVPGIVAGKGRPDAAGKRTPVVVGLRLAQEEGQHEPF